MVGVAKACPQMPDITAQRLERALSLPNDPAPASWTDLAAKRDTLLALTA